MAIPRFSQALADREVLDVKMNGIGSVSFVGSGLKAIGTQNLNGCMAVIMASTRGAVLAHIPPLPFPTTDPDACINHTRNLMGPFLNRCRVTFSDQEIKNSVLVYAMYTGQVAMPAQRDYIHSVFLENLEKNQFPREYSYSVQPGGHTSPEKGTVFIDGRSGRPKLYIENVERELLGP
ncbi:hypothetical protein BDW75DRAFT_221838 [Aspergillus navahoensis]